MRNGGERVVASAASTEDAPVEHAQQHQLLGDGGVERAGTHRGVLKTVLENFYLKSLHSVEAGSKEAPYAYVMSAAQKDLTRVAFIVNVLRKQGIEVGRA